MSTRIKYTIIIASIVMLFSLGMLGHNLSKKSLDAEAPFDVYKRLLQFSYVCNFEKELAEAFANDDMITGHEAIALTELCKKNTNNN